MNMNFEIKESCCRKLEIVKLKIEAAIREIKNTGYDILEIETEYNEIKNKNLKEEFLLNTLEEFLKELEDIQIFSYNLAVLEYINKTLENDHYDLVELKHRYFEVLANMRTSNVLLKSNEKYKNILYIVGYKLIETELILNDKSDVLEELLKSEYDKMNLNLVILSILNEIYTGSAVNLGLIEKFEKLIMDRKQSGSFDTYVEQELIIILTQITKTNEYIKSKKNRLKTESENLEERRSLLDNKFKDTKSSLNQTKKTIEEKNKKRKKLIKEMQKNILTSLISFSIIIGCYKLFRFSSVEEKSKIYDVKTTIYDTLDGEKTSYEATMHEEDQKILTVYINTTNKKNKTVTYMYTYNGEELEKIFGENFDYERIDLTNVNYIKKTKLKEVIAENKRTLTIVTADKDKVLYYDKQYQKEDKILYFLISSIVSLTPYGYSNCLIKFIFNLLEYLKNKKQTSDSYLLIENEIDLLNEQLSNYADCITQYSKLISLLEELKNYECLNEEQEEFLNYCQKKLEEHKNKLSYSNTNKLQKSLK